jgi:sulfide:quinone oxidoreductase
MGKMMELTRLEPNLAIAPQPRVEDLAGLAAAGFRGIVNNRPDGEEPGQPTSAEMAAEACRLGLAYWHIPFRPGEATPDDARAFDAALRAAGGPVLAYCRTGNRARQLWELARQLGGRDRDA